MTHELEVFEAVKEEAEQLEEEFAQYMADQGTVTLHDSGDIDINSIEDAFFEFISE